MKKLTFSVVILIIIMMAGTISNAQDKKPGNNLTDNKLTDKEIKDGWKLLFDGKTVCALQQVAGHSF